MRCGSNSIGSASTSASLGARSARVVAPEPIGGFCLGLGIRRLVVKRHAHLAHGPGEVLFHMTVFISGESRPELASRRGGNARMKYTVVVYFISQVQQAFGPQFHDIRYRKPDEHHCKDQHLSAVDAVGSLRVKSLTARETKQQSAFVSLELF